MKSQLNSLFGFALVLAAVYFCSTGFAQKDLLDTEGSAERLDALEEEVVTLRRQIQDLHVSDSLTGHWIEDSWIRRGEYVDQSEAALGVGFGGPVHWRLASDVSCQRWLYAAEPVVTNFGSFTVDTSKTPAWIDFHFDKNDRTYTIRGIVKRSYGQAKLSLPTDLFDGKDFIDPPRPTSFESTAENGYSVYSLQRESYDRTGVF